MWAVLNACESGKCHAMAFEFTFQNCVQCQKLWKWFSVFQTQTKTLSWVSSNARKTSKKKNLKLVCRYQNRLRDSLSQINYRHRWFIVECSGERRGRARWSKKKVCFRLVNISYRLKPLKNLLNIENFEKFSLSSFSIFHSSAGKNYSFKIFLLSFNSHVEHDKLLNTVLNSHYNIQEFGEPASRSFHDLFFYVSKSSSGRRHSKQFEGVLGVIEWRRSHHQPFSQFH